MFKNLHKIAFFSVIEWYAIKRAVIVFIVSAVLSITFLVGSQIYYNQQKERARDLLAKSSILRSDRMKAQDALKVVNGRYIEEYEYFIKNGFFLKEYDVMETNSQRAALLENIKQLIQKLKFPSLETDSYQFDEQARYPIKHLDMVSNYAVYVEPLTLHLSILHEGDVLRLLNAIEFQSIQGILNVQRCGIERLREIDTEDASKPYFKMTCVLLWYTSRLATEEN